VGGKPVASAQLLLNPDSLTRAKSHNRQEVLVVEAAEFQAEIQVTEGDQVAAAPLYRYSSARKTI
jgi:hypothetical protein